MKKIIVLLSFLAFVFVGYSQVSSKIETHTNITQGSVCKFNSDKLDTLKSADTLSYVFQVLHANSVNPYITQKFDMKAADTTVTLTFYQSADGINWHVLNAGTSPSAYTKSVTATSGNNVNYVGASDIVWFEAPYLKIMYVAKAKTGFKSIPYGSVKFNIK